MSRKIPNHIKIKLTLDENTRRVEALLKSGSLHTICKEAACPNRFECFSNKTATFLILGKQCTRECTFCNVEKRAPLALDPNEPFELAKMVEKLGLEYVVVTSVTRDDLPDGGAGHFASVICELRKLEHKPLVEVLIPDFLGSLESLQKVMHARPDVINHNLETVKRLYPSVRPQAIYERSLELIKRVKTEGSALTKSGIMLGLGEHEDEVLQLLKDLRSAGCEMLTIGQYLRPSHKHHEVVEYIEPDTFEMYKERAIALGFSSVASAPLVRSSYNAKESFLKRQD